MILLFACALDVDEPAPVAWDHVACDHCGMLLSDPRFGAQLATRDGERRFYDDPACLFRDLVAEPAPLANAWFRDSTAEEDAWLPVARVGFVPAAGAPMDGGWAAVPTAVADTITFGEASARVLGGAE